MARVNATAESRTFVRGLITEASPLTFPDNASLSEVNFNLNRDGSRQRRLGFDYEPSYSEIEVSDINIDSSNWDKHNTYKWENAGGDPLKALTVVRFSNKLLFFDLDSQPLSDGYISTVTLPASTEFSTFSFTVVDGLLVVAANTKSVYIYEYDSSGPTIIETTDILKIRDLFGLEDIFDSEDLTQTSNIEVRPTTLTDNHLYNLRNQSFAIPRFAGPTETLTDPIKYFYDVSDTVPPAAASKSFPSNSDNVIQTLYADANDSGNRTAERFFAKDLIANSPGSTRAPIGYFIIDAMERGLSRQEEEIKLLERYPQLDYSLTSLPSDTTPGGPTIVTQFAGRVWYAGFSGEVIDGDDKSPKMSSYILYSRVVTDKSDIAQCYQVGDPTNKEETDILDTDGGFIRIDSAYGIHSMIDLGRELIITAENGVWSVTGGDRNSFTANNYVVDKISDHGSINRESVVRVDSDLIYWGDDGIYIVTKNQFGDRVVENLTQNTIQKFYNNISDTDARASRGYYDSFERKVHWVYKTNPTLSENSKELIYDFNLGAFYTYDVIKDSAVPHIVDVFETKPFTISLSQTDVVVGNDNVEVLTEQVTVASSTKTDVQRELNYLVVTNLSPLRFTFGYFRDSTFYDYKSVDGVGLDAEAELITGYISGGDFQRHKDVPYLTMYMKRSETILQENGQSVLEPFPPSSCLLQAQWDWSDSLSSGKWSPEREVYRLRRGYLQSQVDQEFNYGHNTVVTKNKLRGSGRVLSLRMSTSPGKDCHIFGWSIMFGMGRSV